MGFVERFARTIAVDYEETYYAYEMPRPTGKVSRLLLNGFAPWYNPRKVALPEGIARSLEKYDQLAA